ncbi:MAG: HlyD family secretion protein [Rhizonema sp. NSF051]|nr:HlyD family secretion protein [Rhizonema sp. NSF051]
MERLDSSQQTPNGTGLESHKTSVLEQTDLTSTDSHSDPKTVLSPSKRHLLPKVILGVLLGSGAIAAGTYAYRSSQHTHQYATKSQETDNAYVTANIQPVTSPISGIVTEVAVNDNQEVSPGRVLVKLDSSDAQVSLAQAKASLELAKQQAALAREKTVIINTDTATPVLANQKNQAKQAANREKILQAQTIHRQQYKTALAVVSQKQADLKKAELQLSYSKITALIPGKVGNKNVSVGQRVEPGQTLITVVQPSPWIVANFKETQLEKIQPGQKVAIKMAAFPTRQFLGKVESMSPTSLGKVALLPQDNTTGNSTKTVDVPRIPVKIVFDPESIHGYESRMTPGMSAVAVIETN